MTIRPFTIEDDAALTKMLDAEGIPKNRMQHRTWATCCAEENGTVVGFFTIRHEWGCPSLQHFCVDSTHRNGKVSREMMGKVKELINGEKLIVHAPKGKSWMKQTIEHYFRTAPYGETGDRCWYLVEVKR